MKHALACRCGRVRGHVILPTIAARAVCYCKDCQAYARFLGQEAAVLDAQGGSDIVATMPSHLRFEQGLDALACLSLTPKGILRWYASCCATPIGNTPPDRKVHYVGLVHSCLAKPLEPAFGPARVRLNTASATGPVQGTPVAMGLAILKLMRFMLPARFTARHRDNPFFEADSGRPIVARRVLTPAELAAVKTVA
ncbi:DUF6151 family protein [Ideonella sp. BN130291]|uniref:DUF6151 family protein n=1 Tax=Ideonella sp. BN130291 TaxID=3112940 RepID=UPI002E25FAE6|nr:DUF6151 family protein [Ideonella sp. BN130291]